MTLKQIIASCVGGMLALALVVGGISTVQTIPAGHVGVATFFGDVVDTVYDEGLQFPVNPLYDWTEYDIREKNLDVPGVSVPTADQQTSTIDISVIYSINPPACLAAKSDVGRAEDIVNVKISPNLRSLVRSEGKAVSRCEDLFLDTIQTNMQVNLTNNLQEKVGKYATIKSVLVRNIALPGHIVEAIKNKKVREQRAEEQKAELERYRTEQEQKVAQAKAEREAAEEEAIKKRTLADAEAYEIEKVNEALASSPAYIRLRALETLSDMADDPATKIYFLDGDSPDPLPLMHIGESLIK
jgi:regulator of protease activity HflC (stomatin/prohibitin superfamily)